MRTIPCRRGVARFALTSLVTLLSLIACGGDDPQDPDDGGNGDRETTVLSAASSDGWTCDIFVSNQMTCGVPTTHRSNAIEDFWVPGGFRVLTHSTPSPSGDCCRSQFRDGTITSEKIDLSGYSTLRLKGNLTMHFDRAIGLGECRVSVWLLSNVPNTPDLQLVSEEVSPYQTGELLLEKDLDISLENAIGYREAVLSIGVHVDGGCGGLIPPLLTDVYAELSSVKVVGTK